MLPHTKNNFIILFCVVLLFLVGKSFGQSTIELPNYQLSELEGDERNNYEKSEMFSSSVLPKMYKDDGEEFIISFNTKRHSLMQIRLKRNGDSQIDISETHLGGNSNVGHHYHGEIIGQEGKSMAAVSIYPDKIYGVISDESTNYNLGLQLNKFGEKGVVCKKENAGVNQVFSCLKNAVEDSLTRNKINIPKIQQDTPIVRAFFEIDYNLFEDFNLDNQATLDYVAAVLNINQLVFLKEGIDLRTIGVFLQTNDYAFNGFGDSNQRNRYFRRFRADQNADVVILLTKTSGGIASRVNGLCDNKNKFAVAGLDGKIAAPINFPNFSADVKLLAHEIGHLLGCHHTFECKWGSNRNQALDNCGSSVGCSPGPTPSNGGTIMGYCQNFSLLNGFGPEPRARMHETIAASTCLKSQAELAACTLDSFIIWTECLGSDQLRIMGTVFGENSKTFTVKTYQPNSEAYVGNTNTRTYNIETELAVFNTKNGGVYLELEDLENPDCSVRQFIHVPRACDAGNGCLDTTKTQNYPFYEQFLGAVNVKSYDSLSYLSLVRTYKGMEYRLTSNDGNHIYKGLIPNGVPFSFDGYSSIYQEFEILSNGKLLIPYQKVLDPFIAPSGEFGLQLTSPYGDLLWDVSFGGNRLDQVDGVLYDKEKSIAYLYGATGSFDGDIDYSLLPSPLPSGRFGVNGWVLEIDINTGNLINQHIIPHESYPDKYFFVVKRMRKAHDGGYYLCGNQADYGFNSNNLTGGIFIAKYDSNFNRQWIKTYNHPIDPNQVPNDMLLAPNGDIIVVGDSKNPNGNPYYSRESVIYCLDDQGDLRWQKNYTNLIGDAILHKIEIASDGSYTFIGYSEGPGHNVSGIYDEKPAAWMVNLSTEGEFNWQKTFSLGNGITAASGCRANDGDAYIVLGVEDAKSGVNYSENLFFIKTTADSCGNIVPPPPTGSPDLNLSATTITPNPAQWQNFSITYTLKNEGAAPSQNIQIQAPIVQGIVYQGGNTHQASAGTFNSVSDTWIVPSLAAGASVTLTLNYFNLNTNAKKLFAQVTAMSGTDVDSAPGNNNTGTPNEDDEASLDINGNSTPTCSINAQASTILCSDNGTPNLASDDTYSFSLLVNGSNGSNNGWKTTLNGQNYIGQYGSAESISGLSIAAGSVVLNIEDSQNSACQTSLNVQAPAPCSVPTPSCQLNAQATNVTCHNNGTPNDKTDDTFAFDLLVQGTNASAQGWTSSQNLSGAYNQTEHFEGFAIANGNLNLSLTDAQSTACQTTITVTAPAACSNGIDPPPPPQACSSTSEFPWHEWIAAVHIGTFEQSSDKSYFSDFSSKKIDFTLGNSTNVTLSTGFSYFAYDEYWKIWIDLNGDGAFDDATETVFQQKLNRPANGNTSHDITGQITLPNGTATGEKALRIAMKRGGYPTPCETLAFGEVEDYTANIKAGTGGGTCSLTAVLWAQPCQNNGTNNDPSDDTYGFSILVNGSNTGSSGWEGWVSGRQISGTYGQTATFQGFPISSGNLSVEIHDAEKLTCIANGNVSAPAACSTGGGGNSEPCASSSNFPWHDWISNVKIGNLDYASGKSTFSDFSSVSVTAAQGATLPITLTTGYSWQTYDAYWKIWIDYNQDGAFDEASETAFQGKATAPAIGTTSKSINGQINIPNLAKAGSTKIRVSMKRGAYPTPCETIAEGEVEEYTLNLVQALKAGDQLVYREQKTAEDSENGVLVYPNPTSDRLKVEWTGGLAQVHLSNATGVVLRSVQAENGLELDLSEVSEGLYFVRIEVAGRRSVTRKVVVLR